MHACGHDVHITVDDRHGEAARGDEGPLVGDRRVRRPARRRARRRRQGDDQGRALHPLSQARICARIPCRRRSRDRRSSRLRKRFSTARRIRSTSPSTASARTAPRRTRARIRSTSPRRSSSRCRASSAASASLCRPESSPSAPSIPASKHNIISDRADLQLTVRANDEKTRALLLAGIKRVAVGIAPRQRRSGRQIAGSSKSSKEPRQRSTTMTLPQRLNAAIIRDLGPQAFEPFVQDGMGAEDFTHFVHPDHGVKGYYFSVGGTPRAALEAAKNGGPPVGSHHSPGFKIDRRASYHPWHRGDDGRGSRPS